MNPVNIEDGLRQVLSPGHGDGLGCSAALYRYVAGETSAQESAAFRAHVETCAHCRADLSQFSLATAAVDPRPARRSAFGLVFWLRGLAAATALTGLTLFLWVRVAPMRPSPEAPAVLRAKGGAALHVAVSRDGRTMNWATLDSLAPGDDLRFSYSAASATFPVLFGADETETVERIFPSDHPILREAGNGLLGAAQVDSHFGCQWLVACFFRAQPVPSLDTMAASIRDAVARRRGDNCVLGPIEIAGAELDVKAKRVIAK